MSEDTPNQPSDDSEPAESLPRPKHFVLSPVKDGDYQRNLPTVTAVYLGCVDVPNPEELLKIDGGMLDLDLDDKTRMELCLFLPPPNSPHDAQVMETFAYELSSAAETITEFWDSVGKIKAFRFAVSADNYYFHCRISTDSARATNLHLDSRLLH